MISHNLKFISFLLIALIIGSGMISGFTDKEIDNRLHPDDDNYIKELIQKSRNVSDQAHSIFETTDGGYISTGITGYNEGCIWLIKTDCNGNKVWDKTFGGSGSDEGYSVIETSDQGFVITGKTESFGHGENGDIWLIKTDDNGNKIWDKTFGGDELDGGYSVIETSDQGFVITGLTSISGPYTWDIFLMKTDSDGNKLWNKTFGGNDLEIGFSVIETSDNGFVISGTTGSFGDGGNGDVWLIKTDSEGRKIWDKTFGGSGYDEGYSVIETSDHGFMVAGKTGSFGEGYFDIWLIKTDSEGNKIWDKTFGGSDRDEGYSVKETYDRGYIVTGLTRSFGAGDIGTSDVWLIKTNREGIIQWTNTFGGNKYDAGYSVIETRDQDLVISGYKDKESEDTDVWLIKTDKDGTIIWDRLFNHEIKLPVSFNSGIGLCFSIENVKDEMIQNVSWNLEVIESNGIVLFKRYTNGTIEQILPDENITTRSFLFGFGSILCTIELDWGTYQVNTFLLGPFCIIHN